MERIDYNVNRALSNLFATIQNIANSVAPPLPAGMEKLIELADAIEGDADFENDDAYLSLER